VCKPTVRDQAERLHGSGPPQETSIASLVPDPRLSTYSSKYLGIHHGAVECAGFRIRNQANWPHRLRTTPWNGHPFFRTGPPRLFPYFL
jgi:hypothetical protein